MLITPQYPVRPGTMARNASTAKYPNLQRGLAGAYVPAVQASGTEMMNLANSPDGWSDTTTHSGADLVGNGFVLDASGDYVGGVTSAKAFAWEARIFTVMVIFDLLTSADQSGVLCGYGSGWDSNGEWALRQRVSFGANRNFSFTYRAFSSAGDCLWTDVFPRTLGYNSIAMSKPTVSAIPADTFKAWVNGVYVGTPGSNTNPIVSLDESFSPVGHNGYATHDDAKILATYVWMDRELAQSEIASVHADYLAPLRRKPIHIPYAPAAAAAGGGAPMLTLLGVG